MRMRIRIRIQTPGSTNRYKRGDLPRISEFQIQQTMAEITCTRLTILTTMAVIIQMMGLMLFVFGFFPVKPALSGVSGSESFYPPGCDSIENRSHLETRLPPQRLKSLYQELSGIPPLFDRLILMNLFLARMIGLHAGI
uniref:Uncharacterized protein n=1 Tax=Rhizophora mucronata TaxID=61149 RepID=A0A2P2JD75_RHIMU